MGVRVTDNKNAALYDSVSGFAFGPIFSSAAEAGDFLDWYHRGDRGRLLRDLRELDDEKLVQLRAEWEKVSP